MRSTYAGVDWASEKHDVVIADETGGEILAATFAHDEAGVRGLCRALVRHEVTLVAIERPDGLLVERLLDAGLRILPLHPNQVAATRDRFRASGGKSDRFDALVLSLVATIKTINEQIKQLERQIATAIRERPDGAIFLSLFKKPNSVITAAELLAEIGDCRGRYPTRDTLAADAGQAAVAVESGKRKAACFPLGLQQAPAPGVRHARGHQPPP